MPAILPSKYSVIDLTDFLGRIQHPLSEYDLSLRLILLSLRTMKITKTPFIIFAYQTSDEIPQSFKTIFSPHFTFFETKDYSDYASILSYKTILVSKDRIFYQFLKKFPLTSKMANILCGGEYNIYTSSFLDSHYGLYHYEDYVLWSSTIPSKRLSFPGVPKASLKECHFFNKKNFRSTNTHRFFQRPTIYLPHKKKTVIDFKKDLFLELPTPNLHSLHDSLSKHFPTSEPFSQRIIVMFEQQKHAYKYLVSKKSGNR